MCVWIALEYNIICTLLLRGRYIPKLRENENDGRIKLLLATRVQQCHDATIIWIMLFEEKASYKTL